MGKVKIAIKSIWGILVYPLLYYITSTVIGFIWGWITGFYIGFTTILQGHPASIEEIEEAIMAAVDFRIIALISCLITFFIVWLINHKVWKNTKFWNYSGVAVTTMLLCAVFGLLFNQVVMSGLYYVGLFTLYIGHQDFLTDLMRGNFLMAIFVVALVMPFVEEVIFRGVVLRRLLNCTSTEGALVIHALIFAVVHGDFTQGLYAFFLGLVLGWAYMKFNNIWVPIIMHMAFNLYGVLFANRAGIFEPSSAVFILMTVVAVIACILLGVLLMKRYNNIPDLIIDENIEES